MPTAIARLQRGSAHYFQRPDQDHVSYDPTRTSLTGGTASLRLDKNAGRFTLGGIQLSTRSPEFDINDAGQMRSGDDIDFNADIQLRDTKPNKYVRYLSVRHVSAVAGWNYGRIQQYLRFNQNGQATLHSFWRLTGRVVVHRRSMSDDLTRGGPLMGTPNAYTLTAQVTSRPNVPTTWTARTEYFDDEFGGWRWDASTGLDHAAGVAVAGVGGSDVLALGGRSPIRDHAQATARAATFGQRYIFAFIERSTLSARFRLNYAFTPNFTVEGYAEPFAASGRFYDFGELPAPKSRELRTYGAAGTGTTIAKNAAGVSTVTDGATTFTIPRARLQSPVVPLEPRAALGVVAGEHGVPDLAAEPAG